MINDPDPDDEMRAEVRRALSSIGDAALPPRSFDDLSVPTEVAPGPRGPYAGSGSSVRLWLAGGLAVAAVGLVAFLVLQRDDEERTTATADAGLAEAWEQVAQPPLSPRNEPSIVWTGTEVLVLGGDTFSCPPTASCEAPSEPPMSDGAAYDPQTDTWRQIADAPVGFTRGPSAVLGSDAYFLALGRDEGELTMLRYSTPADAWEVFDFPGDPSIGWALVATDRVLLAYVQTDEVTPSADLVLDPDSGEWSELPDDPLGLSFGRQMVWANGWLYLFDHELVPNPGSDGPSLTRLARLEIESSRWERLGDSEILGTGPWLVEGSRLINPRLGCADGGEVNNYGRCIPNGGVYDTATGEWSELPNAPGRGNKDVFDSGAIGSSSAQIYGAGHPLFDATSDRWVDMPSIADATDTFRSVFTIGADAFVFGGERFDDGELLNDAWIWRSNRTPEVDQSDGLVNIDIDIAALEGTTWILESVSAESESISLPSTGRMTLTFSGDGLSGTTSCIDYSARYELEGGLIRIVDTQADGAGCPPEVVEESQMTIVDVLFAAAELVVGNEGDELTLASESGQVGFRRIGIGMSSSLDLDGSSWVLSSGVGPDGPIAPTAGFPITIGFEAGVVSGSASCNDYSGWYVVEEMSIRFEELSITTAGCGTANLTETVYMDALSQVATIEIQDTELVLAGPSSRLVFKPQL